MNDLLTKLLTALDEHAPRRAVLETYYAGRQPLAFLSPDARAAIGTRFGVMASNLPRLAVNALAERLRVSGFRTAGQPNAGLWADWLRNDLDQLAGVAHREALLLGECFVLVWADADGPRVTIESPRQVAVRRDPATRRITAAVKRWEDGTGTMAVLYEGDRITRYRSESLGATTTGFTPVATLPNPFGQPPVVALRNSDRLLGPGASEVDDLVPLVDGLNKTLADMLVSSEYAGRPRRWATGIELEERPVLDAAGNPVIDEDGEPVTVTVNPYPEGNRMMISEDPASKFGSVPAADLAGYDSAVRVLLGQIAAVSALPAHYLGVLGDQPPSADSLRAAEASLTARAEARQATFGRAWEEVGRLMVAARTGSNAAAVDVTVQWADAATRSIAQEADAVVKLAAAGLLPPDYALARLGYSDDQIAEIRRAREREQVGKTTAEVAARAELAAQLQRDQGLSQPAALAAAGLFAAAAETRTDTAAVPTA
ncbi:phage portal protein [Modestobacter muralis]|uniref:Phage portal protein n=1 Tax=Modestobacter muralis TaxID=1608614 RepID=A0A6P0H8B7_9ACTN|nr:phage portal protein [Modestobacter muralis]NEN51036.1 phage portal protein [Modestobacter muralis]